MSKEAMKLALEALELEEAQTHYPSRALVTAITALREALAEQPAQQEPVATLFGSLPVYDTSPPAQRTWVGLTNNELQPIADEYRILFGSWVEDFARAIEAKLKEKNT